MEHYILEKGRRQDYNLLLRIINQKKKLSEEKKQEFINRYVQPFWLECLHKLHSANQKCTEPLVYWMMLLEYRGLSRNGRQICYQTGIGPSLRTYDDMKAKVKKEYLKWIQDVIDHRHGIVAYDNFAKNYRAADMHPDRKTPYHLKNVTVVGMVRLTDTSNIYRKLVSLAHSDSKITQRIAKYPLASLPRELSALQIYTSKVVLLMKMVSYTTLTRFWMVSEVDLSSLRMVAPMIQSLVTGKYQIFEN